MPSVGEARAQHPLVAGDDGGSAVLGRDIRHEREPWGRYALGRAQREVALVHTHRHLHDFGGQIHVLGGDAAEQRDGALDQPGDFVD